jgi:hypothetical protein
MGDTDKRGIPVMVTLMVPYTSPTTKVTTCRHKCLSKFGYLAKNQDRMLLDFRPQLTGTLLGIDVGISSCQ